MSTFCSNKKKPHPSPFEVRILVYFKGYELAIVSATYLGDFGMDFEIIDVENGKSCLGPSFDRTMVAIFGGDMGQKTISFCAGYDVNDFSEIGSGSIPISNECYSFSPKHQDWQPFKDYPIPAALTGGGQAGKMGKYWAMGGFHFQRVIPDSIESFPFGLASQQTYVMKKDGYWETGPKFPRDTIAFSGKAIPVTTSLRLNQPILYLD